jgi:hypothetical protein
MPLASLGSSLIGIILPGDPSRNWSGIRQSVWAGVFALIGTFIERLVSRGSDYGTQTQFLISHRLPTYNDWDIAGDSCSTVVVRYFVVLMPKHSHG